MAGAHESSVARDLLGAANRLMVKRTPGTRGLWPRATALLARQALEVALKTYWSARAPGVEEAPMRAQLLCLGGYLPPATARDAHQVTEQGVAMLSSVLRSPRAIAVNIHIMRAFVELRRLAGANADMIRRLDALEARYDGQFEQVFRAIRALIDVPPRPRRQIGFKGARTE